ncbi:MAG TPA: hypothetical protein VK822_04125 [Acetobacteraceae bacterium]|nr:hypothetical protein [Acetobacteraceae bacterium]
MGTLGLKSGGATAEPHHGAAFPGAALLDRFEADVTQRVPNGAELLVEPAEGRVTILDAPA